VAVTCLAAAALWLMLPLTTRLATHVPGIFPGDNVAFLWNAWWFRRSFAAHSLGLWCDALFAPLGTSLVLHTHTILEIALGLLLFPRSPPAVAHNLTLIAGVAANGICTYALAFHYTRRSMPSLIAGVMFAWSAFVTLHLAGHFNLVHAWVLPLQAWCAVRFLERPASGRGAALAFSLAAVAYSDYYFFVYALGLTGLLALVRRYSIRGEWRTGWERRIALALLATTGILVALIAAILWTGGWVLDLGPVTISMRGTRNPTSAATLAVLMAAALAYRPRLTRRPETPFPTTAQWTRAALLFVALLSPLILAGLGVVASGGYTSQPLFWRSSPQGIDLATLISGPPRHLILGELVTMFYRSLGIVPTEQSGWIGVVALFGIAAALVRYRADREVRTWLIVAFAFFVIALGPFVWISGVNTGIPGPFALLRYVPVFSNARMPGRAMVIVQLAAAVLTAMVLTRRTRTWREGVVWLLLVIAEAIPRPSSQYALPVADAVDAALSAAPAPGSVLELPAGLRDGFGMVGGLDHRMLVHQIQHGRPLVGGFVARMSPGLRSRYLHTPIFTAAFALSSFDRPRDRPIVATDAAAQGIAFLVVNRDALRDLPSLRRSSLEAAGFRYVVADGSRELYAVDQRLAVR
jgi:hypothetical protein